MVITVEGYEFEGPFQNTSDLKNQIGVYIIYRKNADSGKYSRKYIGYSDDIRDRVEDSSHHKKECWEKETNNQPFYSAYYTTTEQQGRDLETKIINSQQTPCNET